MRCLKILFVGFILLFTHAASARNSDKVEIDKERYFSEDFELTIQKAEQGDAGSQHMLGWSFRDGIKTPKSAEKALYWYEQAAKQNYRISIFDAGVLYFEGYGIPQDIEKGMSYFLKAHSLKFPPATEELGRIYIHGRNGIEKDVSKGIDYLTQSAAQGMPKSIYLLAHAYLKGFGVEKDEYKGILMLIRAGNKGLERAQADIKRFEKQNGGTFQNYLKEKFNHDEPPYSWEQSQ
ncbi:tetratricopeptide repeat protein [Terasakiella sp. A23]|uniref:tetratricopeptide repeat protein n=1 Tax=Terasakiella sp. FCG-A23 TaxID=3080561 RepID=UPI002955AA73|nr:tetratricopeptide repeat protein [Terasakiella sp. A23]MDV7340955.1 tetratricopeptide repeat protein [Terasakiella sp. A23]